MVPIVFELLIDGVDMNWQDCHKRTALGYAAKMVQRQNLIYLLGRGADYAIHDHWGYTLLHESMHLHIFEAIHSLLYFPRRIRSAFGQRTVY